MQGTIVAMAAKMPEVILTEYATSITTRALAQISAMELHTNSI